jgi:hypothetical protein
MAAEMSVEPNADIDWPGAKETLWHKLHADLRSLVPWFTDHHDLLLCPACLRQMKFEELSVDHIIPKQALADDPKAVREAITRNQRSGLTLLCEKPLILKGKQIKGKGCNGWKGRLFDPAVRQIVHGHPSRTRLTSRHQLSMFAVGYLALFHEYGYRVALSPSGRLLRRQFFHPDAFLDEVPHQYQMMLLTESVTELNDQNKSYWDEPFKITINDRSALIGIRSMAFPLPLYDDPTTPIARVLRYVPQRFKFAVDLKTMFDG